MLRRLKSSWRTGKGRRADLVAVSDKAMEASPVPEATLQPSCAPNGVPEAVPEAIPEPSTNFAPPEEMPSETLAPLDALPFEIHRMILLRAPSFDDLRALVRASPQLHRVYAEDRLSILRHFAGRLFDGFLVDAHAAYLSGTQEFQLSRSDSTLWEFVDNYRLATVPGSDLFTHLSLEHVVQIIRFHFLVVEPLTQRYATWALAALSSAPETCPLSVTERQRIQRGLYRLQVFCNLCGSRGEGQSAPAYIETNLDRVRVLSLFPAWQVEEVLCVHAFAKDVYGGVFDRVDWDLNEERNPRYLHVDITSVNESLLLFSSPGGCKPRLQAFYRLTLDADFSCLAINFMSLDTVLRQGLPLLSAILKITDHEELVQAVRQGIVGGERVVCSAWGSDWMEEAVRHESHYARREDWYSEEDAAQDRGDKTPFGGTDTADQPPLAWVTFWGGEVSNLYGAFVPKTFRRWGYVMWDAGRLEASGAMDHIEANSRSGWWDVREDMREDSEA